MSQQSRKITLSDLDRLDNGSFERMVQEIRTFAKNEDEVEYYTRLRIIQGLVIRGQKERMGLPTFPLDFDNIPRKKRTPRVLVCEVRNYIEQEEEEEKVGVSEEEYQGKDLKRSGKRRCCGAQEEEGNQLKKKKKRRKANYNINFSELRLEPPPELPINLREEVEKRGGKDLMLVIMKVLFPTDLNTHNARFSMPASQIVHPEFLRESEKETLKDKEDKKMKGLRVRLIEPSLEECDLCLKEWPMNKTFTYTLISGWNKVFKKNHLKAGDIVQLWSFRCDNKLWFLLHKIVPENRVEANKCSSGELASSPVSVISNHELED